MQVLTLYDEPLALYTVTSWHTRSSCVAHPSHCRHSFLSMNVHKEFIHGVFQVIRRALFHERCSQNSAVFKNILFSNVDHLLLPQIISITTGIDNKYYSLSVSKLLAGEKQSPQLQKHRTSLVHRLSCPRLKQDVRLFCPVAFETPLLLVPPYLPCLPAQDRRTCHCCHHEKGRDKANAQSLDYIRRRLESKCPQHSDGHHRAGPAG